MLAPSKPKPAPPHDASNRLHGGERGKTAQGTTQWRLNVVKRAERWKKKNHTKRQGVRGGGVFYREMGTP